MYRYNNNNTLDQENEKYNKYLFDAYVASKSIKRPIPFCLSYSIYSSPFAAIILPFSILISSRDTCKQLQRYRGSNRLLSESRNKGDNIPLSTSGGGLISESINLFKERRISNEIDSNFCFRCLILGIEVGAFKMALSEICFDI